MRYHKNVYIPEPDKIRLEASTNCLNNLKWRYTVHCIDTLQYRAVRQDDILIFIKDTILQAINIFEYYTNEKNDITKICYRIPYINGMDIILIVSDKKEIITIYTNASNDIHETLDKNLYTQK